MMSTIGGPIPPHPYYDKDSSNFIDRPVPRVRPEAEVYAKQGQGSVQNLFNDLHIQGTNFSSASMRKYKPEPRNHVQDNVRRMREIQRETRRRQEESSKPVKALWKSSKFQTVQSKVKENLAVESASRPQSAHSYLRAHSRTGFTPTAPRSRPSTAEPRVEKLTIPKADSAREVKMKRNNFDFIKVNGSAAKYSGMKRSPSLTALDDLKKKQEEEEKSYRKGQVPSYLRNRQREWREEEERRKAMEPDPDMPPGHRIMEQAEKDETLKKLKMTQNELTKKMASLPIRTDTLRMRKVKEELEGKMAEVEEAIRIFSRPKVFVKLDT